MYICIFEDESYRRLLPLTHLRPVFDLRCGQMTLREKIARVFPDDVFILHTRDYMRDVVKERHPGSYVNEVPGDARRILLVNGRLLFNSEVARKFEDRGSDALYHTGDVLLGGWISGVRLDKFRELVRKRLLSSEDFDAVARVEVGDAELIAYPWDLVRNNPSELVSDFKISTGGKGENHGKVYDGAHLLNPSQIHIGKSTKVKSGVVLDAEKGPIYIAREVEVMPNAVVRGPAFIGRGSIIKMGAKIYENTSIGEMCKVGGEIESSIIQAYSNKQHEGFLGHSYIGEWVNMGADSNTSDLKNDYGSVRIYNDGLMVDTGLQFVGLTMGDHSKCGINSMFNTGTVISACCNVYGSGTPPKYLPAFSWGEPQSGYVTYRIEKAVEVARRVMERRNIGLSRAEEELLKRVFELTVQERDAAGIHG